MPSPVGHSLSGVAAYLLAGRRGKGAAWVLVAFVFLTILPDFDFVPGWLVRQPNLFHRGASHSLFLAVFAGLLAGLALRSAGKGRFVTGAMAGFFLYALHVVLDLFSVDYSDPKGFQILWPYSTNHYIAPWEIFPNIIRSGTGREFFSSLFNLHNLKAVITETILFIPPILLLWGLRGGLTADGRMPDRKGSVPVMDLRSDGT